MEWPSKRIPPGGIMQPARVMYKPEIKEYLNVLIQESKMDMQQRQKGNYFLRTGDSLPKISPQKKPSNPVIFRPGSSKRRTQHTIVNSGAYEREKFQPKFPKVDRQKEIQEFQDKMAFGKNGQKLEEKDSQKAKRNTSKKDVKSLDNRFNELTKEIKERRDWLEEMEALGQGFKYKEIIEQQIQEKVRLMEQLRLDEEASPGQQ